MSHSIGRWLLVLFWLSILLFGVAADPTEATTFGQRLNNNQLVRIMLIASFVMFGVSISANLLHRRVRGLEDSAE